MLTQLLTEEVISIEAGARDWRHAIELATAPLLANGTIEPSYVAALYRSHEELGPYYVLGPGLAMPHARPEDGVNRLGLALTVLKEGVNFGSEGNDPVRLLVTLAASKDDILRILARY
ncbi:PTS sugar transporter subunit IIA [Aeromonas caviae]